jgi:hypothetical protein
VAATILSVAITWGGYTWLLLELTAAATAISCCCIWLRLQLAAAATIDAATIGGACYWVWLQFGSVLSDHIFETGKQLLLK